MKRYRTIFNQFVVSTPSPIKSQRVFATSKDVFDLESMLKVLNAFILSFPTPA